ncbi:MAG: Holliday junction branch migration protein RuvA [Blastocatellia bacterium]|nr:Holliday junction branch migration protein RuvA [Blastocatellia bacterium]
MIAYLTGKLLTKSTNHSVVDIGGVGYEVQIPLSTYYKLGDLGAVATFHVFTYVREDAIQLYGFHTPLEKELFLKLISVSGVGPKLALTLLSGLSADELIQAVVSGNLVRLTSIPGVGKKTGERLVIELRDKLKSLSTQAEEPGSAGTVSDSILKSDLVSALVNFGWQQSQAEKAVSTTLKEEQKHEFEWLLKQALKKLYR